MFELLKEEEGWTARALAKRLECGEAWVFEIYRIFKAVDALRPVGGGRYRFATGTPLADAMVKLLDALEPFKDTPVSRPPSRGKRQKS